MESDFLNANLRRTSSEEEKVFVENRTGPDRAIRCYREDTLRAATATALGRTFHPLGPGESGDTMALKDFTFTWSIAKDAWVFSGPFYEIQLKPPCSREDGQTWLESFTRAESQSSAMYQTQKLTHVVGVTQTSNQLVAATSGTQVTWFNIAGMDRLFAAALVDATRESPYPIQFTRMIHHEVGHSFELSMKDWLQTLAADLPHANLDLIAHDLNPQYLPARLEDWAEKRLQNPRMADDLDEELAAEFLVEDYAQRVIEGKPWTHGLWPALDELAEPMKSKLLTPPAAAKAAHVPLQQTPERIMRVPKTIIVKASEPGGH